MAAQRIGLDSLLPGAGFYTVFAPVDTAMASAGLDAAHISVMSVDTLRRIVLYHVVQGAYSDGALTAALNSIQANALLQDITYNLQQANTYIYQQMLYIKKTGALYINGEAVNDPADTALPASNGYIWPVRTVLEAPQQTIWGLLQSRPELSLYLAGQRMITVNYANQQNSQATTALPAVFAPTDSAFAAAGIHSTADLLTYATRTMAEYVYDQNYNQIQVFSPLDSVFKQHYIVNGNYTFSNLSLYNDLLFNAGINNGAFNLNQYAPGSNVSEQLYLLQFSNASNTVHIKWSSQAPAAVLPADKNAHFMTTNGVVYEINQLFLPNN
jgi:uncharacterized surface protein with fasciclin (FAS1) repeats